jgi:hypothetical protein
MPIALRSLALRAEQSELPVATSLAQPVVRLRCAFDPRGLCALGTYFALAVVFFARELRGRSMETFIGRGPDPPQLMWLMAWWPHAFAHGLNPLFTDVIWAPRGVDLAWATAMPLLSVLAAPLIAVVGPVVTYNVLCVLAIALAAWCAFILCRYVTAAYWPALVGGYVFGFSAYMLGQTLAHLDLLLVFPIPLLVLLLIRAFQADLSWRLLVAGLVSLLVAQFLLFIELFATTTLFIGIALVVILVVGSAAEKTRVANLVPSVALSYAITLLLLSPYFYFMAALGHEPGPPHPPLLYSTDLLNLFVPTPAMELGRVTVFSTITGRFLGYIYEAGGYVGVPLIALAVAFVRRRRDESWARALAVITIIAIVLSLGPFVLIAGRPIIPMPGAILSALPLINKALPARLMVYAFLALALMTALWMNEVQLPRWQSAAAAAIIVLSMLPNLSARFWTSALDVPAFFRGSSYTKYLAGGETIVALPYGYTGNSMAWQLESGWYFRMAGGYAGSPPAEFRRWPIVRTFYRVETTVLPDAGEQMRAFLGAHRADAVLVDDRAANVWHPLIATLGVSGTHAGGITIYRIPAAELTSWRTASAREMETRADQARFAALVIAADNYLRSDRDPAALTAGGVFTSGMLPAGWVVVPEEPQPPWDEGGLNLPRRAHDAHLFAGMWLKSSENGRVTVGVAGSYSALRAIVGQYRADAVSFSPPDLSDKPAVGDDDQRGMLIMTFDRDGLRRAASQARADDLRSRNGSAQR